MATTPINLSDKAPFEARLEELRPQVEEYERVRLFLDNWNGQASASRSERKRGTTATATRAARGERPQQFLAAVTDNPGTTVSEIAQEIGVKATYLYRIASTLEEQGDIVKQGKGYYPPSHPDLSDEAEATGDENDDR